MAIEVLRRPTSMGIIGVLLIGLVALLPAEAEAGVTGGCEGSADFTADTKPAYTPDFDTKGNPIIVPKADGNVAKWEGSVPGENKDFSGKVEIRIGPAWVKVADWGFPDHNGANVDDERMDDGDYDMDQVWDIVPKNIAQGIYEARASHKASGVDCQAQFFVKFEGNALESPVVIVTIVLLIIFLVLLIIAGRATGRTGFFSGQPVLAVVAALFLAITIAVLLQQFCVQPLDNLTTIILPLAMVVIGLLIAQQAPFGGAPREIGRTEQPLADLPEDAGEIFSDGFESGDTSAWSDPES